jgi:hypothetical protein
MGTQTRFSRRKPHPPAPKKALALLTHNFVENLPEQELDVKSELQTGNIFAYHAFQIPNWNEYKQIFGLYKINKVVVTFKKDITGQNVYNDNISSQNQSYALQNVELSYLRDYTDTTAPANMTAFKTNSKVKQVILSNSRPTFSLTLTPAVQKVTTYQDELLGTVTKTQPEFKQWLDVTYEELLHRGLQVMVTGQNLSSKGKIRMSTKVYFSCKNQQ